MLVFRYLISATVLKAKSSKFSSKPKRAKINSQVPITVVGATLIDKSGRRPLIMVYCVIAFI